MARQVDGYVTIGFKTDRKQFENDLRQLDRDLDKYAKERMKLNEDKSSTEKIVRGYEEAKKHADDLNHSLSELFNKEKQLEKQHEELGAKLRTTYETTSFSTAERENLREKLHGITIELGEVAKQRHQLWNELLSSGFSDEETKEYEKAKKELEEINNKISEVNKRQEGTALLASNYKERLEDINSSLAIQQKQQQQIENFSQGIKQFGSNIGNSMEKLIKKTAKWALAIFGVRSVYQTILRSINLLSQYDEKLANDLEYMRFSLAMALKPIVEWIVNAVMKLIQFINSLIYKLTGVNLLAKATPKEFNKATNSLKNANKEAKELRKQLAGFDEMSILDDNVKVTDDVKNKVPSINLSNTLSDADLDKIFDKIKTKFQEIFDNINFDKLKSNVLDAIMGYPLMRNKTVQKASLGILGMKPEEIVGTAMQIPKLVLDVAKIIFKFNDIVFDTLDEMLKPIQKFFEDHPIDIGFKRINLGSKKTEIIDGLSGLQGTINKSPLKLDKIDISKITSAFSGLPAKAQQAWASVQKVFNNVGTFFANTFSNAWAKVKNVFSTGGKIFTGIKEGIESSFKTIVNKLIDGINKIVTKPFEKINDTLNTIKDVKVLGLKPFKNLWSSNPISIPKIPKLATGAILNMPGKGVYHDGSIMAERGAEGILPLTDASAMRLLGQTIGEYITITANIENNMNGRLISRLIKEIQGQQDFSYNR